MILADSSIWIDHLHKSDAVLTKLLLTGLVLAHPFITGELALGHVRQRKTVLQALENLPQAILASDSEVLDFIERNKLAGLGIGYVDAHLLASARLTSARLWTRDKKLHFVATKLKLAY